MDCNFFLRVYSNIYNINIFIYALKLFKLAVYKNWKIQKQNQKGKTINQ